ncbi:hypothetical protein DV737_g4443, partial [Chaetothyriales sp. CBS 132003]
MAVDDPQQQQLHLLTTVTNALTNAADALHASDDDAFAPPTDGLSLLDAKNSLLLSYLQSLVLLLLVQLRQVQGEEAGVASIGSAVQQKLTELRVYLDRGVRPIEGRLKYQIDSALRAADSSRRDAHAKAMSRVRKSQLLNEYIDEELSSAPRAQPSIGSNKTILDGGRGGLSQRDREKERERSEYEERNFTRLPAQTKKERREARRKGQLDRRDIFGGEDWTGLGGLGDRVSRSVSIGRGGREGVLKRREKRRATEDLPRSDGTGMGIGDSFEKRRRTLEARAARKAMKKR